MGRRLAFLWFFALGMSLNARTAASSVAQKCYNNAIDTLNQASDAKSSSEISGASVAASASGTSINSQGATNTAANASRSSVAASQAGSCVSIAKQAKSEVSNCPARATSDAERSDVEQAIKNNFNPQADKIIASCSQSSAGYSAQSSSMSNMATTMMMMSAMSGMGASSGSSDPSYTVPDYDYNVDDKNDIVAPTRPAIKVTTTANERDPQKEVDPAKGLDLGTEDKIVTDAEPKEEDKVPTRGFAGNLSSVKESGLSTDPTSSGSTVAALSPAGDVGESGEASKDDDKDFAGVNFEFRDLNAAAPAEPDEARDAAYTGKSKKIKKSLAAEMVERKKLEAQEKAKRQTASEARVRKLAADFVVSPKSCAERGWKGSECRALKADPLLQ